MPDRRELPAWARWTGPAAATRWSVGIEEEVMLLDPHRSWSVANRIDAVLAVLPPDVVEHAAAETHACVVELRTAPHPSVAAAGTELALLRRELDAALRDTLGLRAASLAYREPTMAQHVHAARQRRFAGRAGLPALPAWLAGEFAPAAELTAAA